MQTDILRTKLEEMSTRFRDKFSNHGYRLAFTDDVVGYFTTKYGASIEKFGGRGVVNALDDEIAFLVAEQKLWAEQNGSYDVTFTIFVDDNGVLACRL